MNEKEIYTTIEALQKAVPVRANWIERNKPADYGDGKLLLETNKKKYTFTVELKKELRTINIPKLAALKEHQDNLLVIAKVIYPNIEKQLQELHIIFMDTLGNIFIQQGELLLLINGDKAQAKVANNTGGGIQ